MATEQQVIAGLYAAFFNRAPDAEGLAFWEGQASGGNDLETFNEIAAGFALHPTFSETYDSMTDAEFVDAIYVNSTGFGPDEQGSAFWIEQLGDGMSRSDMVASFVFGVLNIDLTDPEIIDDLSPEELETAQMRQDTMTNKADVGIYFTEAWGEQSNITMPDDLENDPAYQASIAAIANVDETDQSVEDAEADIDATAPITFTLSAEESADFEGSANTFTVELSRAADEDMDVTFNIVPTEFNGSSNGTDGTNNSDFNEGAFNPVVVTIAAGESSATFDVTPRNDGTRELIENYSVTATINGDTQTATSSIIDGTAPPADPVFTLTPENDGDVMRITGDQSVRIDFTNPDNQITGLDLDGDGTIEQDGMENAIGVNSPVLASGFTVVDAYARNPLNASDNENNFLGDIHFDGTGFDGDGTSTDGNIFLGGLGSDVAFGGIGNDFLTAGQSGYDELSGGRNADMFFVELSELDVVNGDRLEIDGGSTADDTSAGSQHSNQDSDWLFLDASDDDEPVKVQLDGDGYGWVGARSYDTGIGGNDAGVVLYEVENFNASGNLFGVLDGFGTSLGGSDSDHYTLGSTAQLDIDDNSSADNIIIGGFDNDKINSDDGNDIIFGGDMQFLTWNQNNPNILNIPNDGMDEIDAGSGNDHVMFEMDGGSIDGGADHDTLWLTNFSGGTEDSAGMKTTDGVVRIDLISALAGSAGHGGADVDGTSDQTNYESGSYRNTVTNMESVNATGLGAIDYNPYGTNDIDHQENYFAFTDANLDLRGLDGGEAFDSNGNRVVDNNLYASSGHDELEGRGGNDNLMGGEGNDDFIFSLEQGDDLDVIHRLTDTNDDNIWDGGYSQDFGLDSDSSTGESSLILTIFETDNPGNELENITVTEITSVIRDNDGDIPFTLNTQAMRDANTYNELLVAVQDAIAANPEIADSLTAELTASNQILITDAESRVLEDQEPDALFGVTANNLNITVGMDYGEPEVFITEDRLLFVSYEDRNDNELVDDDAVVGSSISLGSDAYAQDVVVSFDEDGTRIAEDQLFRIDFTNLAVEDVATITVNGTVFQSQVGVALNGTLLAGETTDEFIQRFADEINDYLDIHTAAGEVNAQAFNIGGDTNAASMYLSQANYRGEETVFMNVEVNVDDNSSNGEGATAVLANVSQSEVHLLDFDGRDGNLNADNVLFLGDTHINRAALATAENAGGELNGSDAIVVNVAQGDAINSSAPEGLGGEAIFFNEDENLATPFGENFAVHGDDLLIGADGADTINGGTGDDRIHGSRGADTLDGGKNLYLQDGEIRVYNEYEATQADAQPGVVSIELIKQYESGMGLTSGIFDDTLLFQQADFGMVGTGGAEFTITLDADASFPNGGAGTVVVTEDGETTGTTRFTNFENVRTVSGDGTLAGQGRDTLDISALSTGSGGVRYSLTDGGGMVEVDNDLDNFDPSMGEDYNDQRDWADFFRVDGVEHIVTGSGEDVVRIDETEAGKDNLIQAGLGTDAVEYSFNVGGDDAFNPAMTLTVNGGGADVDHMDMTLGLVGLDMPRDVLESVEIIHLGDAARNPALDDTLDVTLVNDAVVDFVNGEVRNGSGAVEVEILNMADFEVVNADFSDTVIVSDDMANSRLSNDDDDLGFDSFLNYDLLDERGSTPVRMSIGDLRSTPAGTDDTADEGDIPEAENIGLFTFNMGEDADTVDYSNETGLVAAVVDFEDETNASVSNVLVSHDNDIDFDDNGNRVDALTGTENVVASQGNSVVDLTGANSALKVRFNADDGATETDATLDRDTYRIQLSELNTTAPVSGINFLEYEDAGNDATVTADTAQWNTIEFGDEGDMAEVTDHESTRDINLNFRGGSNEVNFNELTRSIDTTITVTDYDANNPTTSGIITAVTTFTDGNNNPLPGGGTNTAVSHSAQNAIAAGGLRIEASQDAEDIVEFAGDTEKLFILGEVIDGSDQITVTLGSGDTENTVEMTGFEQLRDADSDDVYTMDDLSRTFNNLTLVDNAPGTDNDTIAVFDDAIGFQGAAANEINLEELNDDFAFDFNLLDITGVTNSGLTITGDTDAGAAGRVLVDTLILGDLDLVDSTTEFTTLALTDDSVTSSGSTFELDLVANELQGAGDGTLFTIAGATIADTLDASRVTSSVNLSVTGAAGTLIGGSADDTLTGGVGNDTLQGNAGADTLDGGTGTEVRQIQLSGILGSGTADGTVDITFNGFLLNTDGGNTLAEGSLINDGAGSDEVGAALATQINANIAAINAGAAWTGAPAAALVSASYDNTTDLLTFEYAAGADIVDAEAIVVTVTAGTDASTLLASAQNVISDGGDGGNDTFVFNAFATADTVNDFVSATDAMDVDIEMGTGTNGVAANGTTFAWLLRTGFGFTTVTASSNNALNASELFSGSNLADLQANILGSAHSGIVTANRDAIAFGRTTVSDKLYVFTLTDAVNANTTQITQTRTIATVGSAFVAADITLV